MFKYIHTYIYIYLYDLSLSLSLFPFFYFFLNWSRLRTTCYQLGCASKQWHIEPWIMSSCPHWIGFGWAIWFMFPDKEQSSFEQHCNFGPKKRAHWFWNNQFSLGNSNRLGNIIQERLLASARDTMYRFPWVSLGQRLSGKSSRQMYGEPWETIPFDDRWVGND